MQPHVVDTAWFTLVLGQETLIHQVIQLAVMAWQLAVGQLVLGFGAMAAQDKMPQAQWTQRVTPTAPKWLAAAALVQFVLNPCEGLLVAVYAHFKTDITAADQVVILAVKLTIQLVQVAVAAPNGNAVCAMLDTQ
jgi:hypothetical protein